MNALKLWRPGMYQLLVDSGDVCHDVSVGDKTSLGIAWGYREDGI